MDKWEHLKSIIQDQMNLPQEKEITKETMLEDLGGDLLDAIEFVMAIEEEFGIEIPDADAERWKTCDDVFQYIERFI